ncbi:hypothetical protein CEXT_497761 [Caerostris extrusa]|uniref:Ycf15 n=1 Tax=Caerostris extrusa TaxID=172846 RepID=A0AAV4XUT7_CAEEX|nr:hypothetical protein CEXT_497761 [Caerostris extrusa]
MQRSKLQQIWFIWYRDWLVSQASRCHFLISCSSVSHFRIRANFTLTITERGSSEILEAPAAQVAHESNWAVLSQSGMSTQ